MNYKQLLIDTLSVQSYSGQEDLMIAYIQQFVKDNVPQATIEVKDNNIYVTKGTADYYPCIVSHTDTVHNIHQDFGVYERDGVLFAFSNDVEAQVGIGGDDKVGVWIGLQMLLDKDVVKCAFFHSEEIGCVGSSAADMNFFKDVGYCFQSDRRGNKDFVNNIYNVELFSEEFSHKISSTLKKYGYAETSGALTDVYQLKLNGLDVCVANMSSGYYAPHTDKEVVDVADATNCCDMISSLIDLLGCNLYVQKSAAPSWDEWSDWKPRKKSKDKLSNRVTYKETYDSLGYAYVNGNLVGNKSYNDWDMQQQYDYEDDNMLTNVGKCQWCDSNVYVSDAIADDCKYCIGCDMIVDDSQVVKI
jgi:hypothetical protein